MTIAEYLDSTFGLTLKEAMIWITCISIVLEGILLAIICLATATNAFYFLLFGWFVIIFFVVVLLLLLEDDGIDNAPDWAHQVCIVIWWLIILMSVLFLIGEVIFTSLKHEMMFSISDGGFMFLYIIFQIIFIAFMIFGGLTYWDYYKEIADY